MEVKGKSVFVGLSGGVDSAVSAALLLRGGANVTGVFIKGWYPPGMHCTWAEDRRDAMRVAAHLHIPFLTLDASVEYKKEVIDYLLREYRAGRTPNPDVLCNKEIKFGVFYRFAKSNGADHIATGHYRRGEKDQSYFLWAVPKAILDDTIFPVGEYDKNDVRALAQKFNLPVARKKDSQGICFLGSVSVEEFLRNEFSDILLPGNARNVEGNTVGKHDGVLLHTIGERIALKNAREPGPWFVVSKDIATNEFVVARKRASATETGPGSIPFKSPNWFADSSRATRAQYRYRGPFIEGHIKKETFVPEKALPEIPASGQSLVFYNGTELVGGSIVV